MGAFICSCSVADQRLGFGGGRNFRAVIIHFPFSLSHLPPDLCDLRASVVNQRHQWWQGSFRGYGHGPPHLGNGPLALSVSGRRLQWAERGQETVPETVQ